MTRKIVDGHAEVPSEDFGEPTVPTLITTLLDERATTLERPATGAFKGRRRGERYQLCFEIASGGMATVYLAMMDGPGGFRRPVALKRIHPHLAKQQEFVRMFEDEARITAQIVHPNVCQVHDFGLAGGQHYLAMEYLVGETLATILPRAIQRAGGPGDPRERGLLAHLFAAACEGLHAAHTATGPNGESLGVVHRDVSPHNLLVTYDGQLKVLDFGIAYAANRNQRTRSGDLKGSLAYVSPEQVHGGKGEPRSDVWSLGVCLWEALAGRRLFRRESPADSLYAIVNAPIPRLDAVVPSIPQDYADAVETALQRDLERRWPTARAFGEALRRALRAEAASPTPAMVAEWMDDLFVGGREDKRALLRRASELPPEVVVDDPDEPVEAVPPRPSMARRIGVAAAIALAALALVGGGIAVGMSVNAPDTTAIVATAPPSDELAAAEEDPAPDPPAEVEPADSADPVPSEDLEPTATDELEGDAEEGELEQDQLADDESDTTPETLRRPRRRRRPRPAASGQTGLVNVVVPDGWGIVYHRGRRLGQTPYRGALPVGAQTIEVRIEGRRPIRRVRVDVQGDRTTPVVVRAR